MKRTIKTIFCAAAAVLAAVSCQKSVEPVQTAEEGKGTIDVRVNGLMGEYNQQDGVKSSLVNTVRVAWAAGDVVYVFDGTKYLGKLTASLDKKADGETDEDRYAKLSGTISAPATTTCTLTLVHSSLMTALEDGAEVSELSIDMSTQSTDKVPFVAYATMDYTGIAISDAVVPFQFATSVIKVNCTGLKANTAITSATLTNVNTACKLTLSGSEAPTVSGDVNGTITRTGDAYFAADKVNGEGEAVFQIAVPILETASEARVLTVAQGSDKFKDKNFSKKAINPATSVNTVCQLVGLPAGALPGVFTVSNDGGTTTTQIHFSQGNLYYDGSEFNFEANQYDSTPSYDGSWSTDHISHFYWSKDARVAYSDNYGNANTTYGITPDASDVFFTNETETTAKAGFTVNVGGKEQSGWRTLSTEEWDYLFNSRSDASSLFNPGVTVCGKYNCVVLLPDDWVWDASTVGTYWQDGGYPETSTDKVTWQKMHDAGAVCLPATGYRDGSGVGDVGNYGVCWSSSANDSRDAHIVYFDGGSVYPDIYDRDWGYSVRLITEAK